MVHPFRQGQDEMDRLTERQERVMLRPARETLGMATRSVWTDYLSNLRTKDVGQRVRPHLELYSLGSLPALLASGVSVCSSGIERTVSRMGVGASGERTFYYPQSRPEMLATQTRHYQRALGVDLAITNLNLLFTSLMAFRLLAERYPHALRQIAMCNMAPGVERWCYECAKCAEYAYYSLGCGAVDPDFDYDYLFTHSRYAAQVMPYLKSGVEPSRYGVPPWRPFICTSGHYLGICRVLGQFDPRAVADRLSPEASANLSLIKARLGKDDFPGVEMLSSKSVELIGTDLARDVARIAAEHFPVVDDLPPPWLEGNNEVSYDFDVRMPTRTGLLDHIRS